MSEVLEMAGKVEVGVGVKGLSTHQHHRRPRAQSLAGRGSDLYVRRRREMIIDRVRRWFWSPPRPRDESFCRIWMRQWAWWVVVNGQCCSADRLRGFIKLSRKLEKSRRGVGEERMGIGV